MPKSNQISITSSQATNLIDAVTGDNASKLYDYNEMHGTAYVGLDWDHARLSVSFD